MRDGPHTVAVVPADDRLGPASLDQIRRQVSEAVHAARRVAVIDLSAVGPVDNDTLCQLCQTLRSLGGAPVRVSGADLRVRRVLTLCAIDGLELAPPLTPTPLRRPSDVVRSLRARWRRAVARHLDIERSPSRPLS